MKLLYAQQMRIAQSSEMGYAGMQDIQTGVYQTHGRQRV